MLRMLREYFQVAGSQPLKVTFIIVIIEHLLDYVLECARYPAEISIYIGCQWHLLKIHCSQCNFLQLLFVNQQEVPHSTIIRLFCS